MLDICNKGYIKVLENRVLTSRLFLKKVTITNYFMKVISSELIDHISGECLPELASYLKITVDITDIDLSGPYIVGYCVSPKTTYSNVTKFFQDYFKISDDGVFDLIIEPGNFDIRQQLFGIHKSMNDNPNDTLLVKVTGFEKLFEESRDNEYRIGHDYIQLQKENPIFSLNRKVLNVTHIDSGHEKYFDAFLSARNSQFKDFLYEFD